MSNFGIYISDRAHFTYMWTIENPCSMFRATSPIFIVKEMEMTEWSLIMDYFYSNYVRLFIFRVIEDGGPVSIEVISEVSLLDDAGFPLTNKADVKSFQRGTLRDYPEFEGVDEIFCRLGTEILRKNAITVRCRMWRTGTDICRQELCFARTHLIKDSHSFVWAVRDFSTLQQGQERKFILYTTATNQLAFNLFVTEEDGEEYVGLSIQNPREKDYIIIKIDLLDFEGKVVLSEENGQSDDGRFEFRNIFRKFELMAAKKFLLPNNVLSLRCEVEAPARSLWSRIESHRFQNSISPGVIACDANQIVCYEQNDTCNVASSFVEAIKSLLEEGTLSDVSLRAGSKSFPAHKCILGARSPVFKAMFSGDMKEKTSKCVEISEVDEDTMGELLSYIYTDKVRELEWRSMVDLYIAADKYELLDLKRRCATLLKKDLTASSVCVVLSVADLHNDPELRQSAQDFISCQGSAFFTSDTWQNFKKENLKLCAEILEKVVGNLKRHCGC